MINTYNDPIQPKDDSIANLRKLANLGNASQVDSPDQPKQHDNSFMFSSATSFSPLSLKRWRHRHPNAFRDGTVYSCFVSRW